MMGMNTIGIDCSSALFLSLKASTLLANKAVWLVDVKKLINKRMEIKKKKLSDIHNGSPGFSKMWKHP